VFENIGNIEEVT